MPELKPPFDDWQPGEPRIRHHERFTDQPGSRTRVERWEWSIALRCWRLMAVFPGDFPAAILNPKGAKCDPQS